MIERYTRIYRAFVRISISRFVAYRGDFFSNVIVGSGVWVFFNVFSMYLVTARTGTVFGWSRGELILISCLYNVFIGVFGFLFVRSMTEFPDRVNKGTLDLLLLKPVDSQFYVSTYHAGLHSLLRTVLGIILAVIVCISFNISVHPLNIVYFLLASFLGLLLLYSLLFFLNTFTIWTPRIDNITELFYTLRSMGRYPRETFRQISEIFFIFASPFVIILSTPTKVLLGRANLYDWGELTVLCVAGLVICRYFWKFALRFYTSASS